MAKLLHPICAARSLLPVAALLVFAQCGANGNTVDARSDAAPNDAAVGDARQGALGPTFWAGAYLNGGGFDSEGIAAAVQADIGHSIPVLQTYRSTAAAGIAKIATDLNAIYALGAIPHLYIEPAKDLSAGWPANYTRTQYENASVDPEIAADLGKVATAVVDALVINAQRQLLFSFGAEMNGGWTPWGCLTPSTFVALHSKMHMVLSVEMQQRGVAAQRVRWVYAPDSRGSTKRQDGRGNDIPGSTCNPSTSAYYPGHAQSDYLGMSAYRSGEQSVADAVLTPAHQLLDALQIPEAWRRERFVVLQTGARDTASRPAFVEQLHTALAADPVFAGVIWFNAAQYSLRSAAGPTSGYDAWRTALHNWDGRPSELFARLFWDVAPTSPYYSELQRLGGLGISGCAALPRQFCPDTGLTRAAAAVFLGKVFGIGETPNAPAPFTDVPSSHPNFAIITALVERGALQACSANMFCPATVITRTELDTALRALGGTVAAYPAPNEPVNTVSRGAGGAHIVHAK